MLTGIGSSMTSALSHLGATVHVCDGHSLPTTMAQCMDQAVNQGAAAVVTGYIDYALIEDTYHSEDWYGGDAWQQKYLAAWGAQ